MVSLNHCAFMHKALNDPVRLELVGLSRGERRRRSLCRGIARWHLDTLASTRGRPRVLRLALTSEDPDPLAVRGAIRAFWTGFRNQFGRHRYFSWAELQLRGAVHYHALIVDPPWRLRRHADRWIRRHWPHARIQPDITFQEWSWFTANAGRYVRNYAKKRPLNSQSIPGTVSGSKAYQQDYDQLPREIRTWESNRLAHRVAELLEHLDGGEIVCTAPPFAPRWERVHYYWLIARLRHTPPRSGCTLIKNHAASERLL